MPDLRARLADELENHGVCVCGKHNYVKIKLREALSDYPNLLDALVRVVEKHISRCPHHPDGSGMIACEYCEQGWRPRPTPSREALNNILLNTTLQDSDAEYVEAIKDRLMAWATGEPKRWCEHIQWHVSGDGATTHQFWLFDVRQLTFPVPNEWSSCPVPCCSTRRPE